jgi:electron transport complex protein RnfB
MTPVIVLSVMGLLLGLGLAFASDIFKVEIDERQEKVTDLLPGYNCGACGYPGGSGFAEGIVEGKVEHLTDCKPGKDEQYDAILAYLKDHPSPDGTIVPVKK